MLVGDYSDRKNADLDGRIDAADWRARGYGGAVRYLRKRQASGVAVLVTSEVRDFVANAFPFAAVYEDGAAGWMAGGASVGTDRGLWALLQCRNVGFEPRGIYFADDAQSTGSTLDRVLECLDAARTALARGGTITVDGNRVNVPEAHYGRDVGGYYGFATGMQAVAGHNLAKYRWLTGHAPTIVQATQLGLSLYQRNWGGPYVVAGVTVDVSDVYQQDWGQLPDPTPAVEHKDKGTSMFYMETKDRPGVVVAIADLTGVPVGTIRDAFKAAAANGMLGAPISETQYDLVSNWAKANGLLTKRYDDGAATLREMLQQWPALRAKVDALQAGGGSVDVDALATAVADKIAQRLES